MKHLKIYEDYVDDSKKPANITEIKEKGGVSNVSKYLISKDVDIPIDAKFKLGDIVIFENETNKKYWFKISHYYLGTDGYYCYILSYPDNDFSKMWIRENELRLATLKEIEELYIKINSKKYNI